MKSNINKISLIAVLLIFPFCNEVFSGNSVGKIVKSRGIFYINNKHIKFSGSTNLHRKDSIQLDSSSRLDISLHDKTALRVYGPAKFTVVHIRSKEKDLPSYLKVEYGSMRVIQKNRFTDHSLTILTTNSIIKSVNSSFDFISSTSSDMILLRKGKIGLANIKNEINRALVIKPGYEIMITKKKAPIVRNFIKIHKRKMWISNRKLTSDKNNIKVFKVNDGLIEWMLTPVQ